MHITAIPISLRPRSRKQSPLHSGLTAIGRRLKRSVPPGMIANTAPFASINPQGKSWRCRLRPSVRRLPPNSFVI
jgi:hypothetical protein